MLGIIATNDQGELYLSPALGETLGLGADPARRAGLSEVVDPDAFEAALSAGAGARLGLRSALGETLVFETRAARGFPAGWRALEVSAELAGDPRLAPRDPELELLATASHELRVPLNGVIGFSHLLGNTELDADQKLILEKLQSCNYLLKGLINDILEYARVATAKVDLVAEPLDLEAFVNALGGLFQDRAERKGLTLLVEADPSLRARARLPKLRVTQVVSNLLSNAIKFTDAGWARLAARLVPAAARLELVVEDSGPGIPAADRESVFQPFGQARSAATRDAEGSGLGLAISRGLVELMGGELILGEGEQGGSRFEIFLPVELVPEGAPAVREAVPPKRRRRRALAAGPNPVERRHVLIVEDNKLNADILGHFLRDHGATYDVAATGQEAVEMYQDGKFDLVLMDIMLPELDGYQASERILTKCALKPPVPIIGVTAKVFRSDQARCFAAGMVEVLNKPVDFQRLREAIGRALGPRETEPEPPAEEPGAEEPAARGAIDLAAVDSYLERMTPDDGSRRETAQSALDILDDDMRRLEAACAAGDSKEIGLRAHSLKGAFALLGAPDAADLSKGLEAIAGRGGASLRAEHWRRMIAGAYAAYKRALESHLAGDSEAAGLGETQDEAVL